MSDYDYLNARVRAMSRFLLPNEVYDQILAAEADDILIDLLLDSTYGERLSARLPDEGAKSEHGLVAAETALREGLFDTFSRIRVFAPEVPRRLIGIQLNRWDMANVIAILRGVHARTNSDDIMHALIPAGEFNAVQLGELAKEPDMHSVAESLTTWGYPFAYEVRRAILDHEGDVQALEAYLYARYFTWALESLDATDPNESILRTHLQMQLDLTNVNSALKHVAYRVQGRSVGEYDPIPGGKLRADMLHDLVSAQNIEYALEVLDQTYFAPAVERGILIFGQTNRFSVLERFLDMVVIEKGVRLFRADPLSLSVPLGFIWRKVNEYYNLRMLLRGRRYRLPPNAIREELIFV